jgi:hypothetical protein
LFNSQDDRRLTFEAPDPMSNPFDHKEMVLAEICSTEESMHAAVDRCLESIITPLLAEVNSHALVLSNRDFLPLFAQYRVVLRVSGEFMVKLNEYRDNPEGVPVTSIFANFDELVPGYFEYIKAFHLLSPHLRKERKTNKAFDQFCEAKETELVVDQNVIRSWFSS